MVHAGNLPVGFRLGDFGAALDGPAYVYAFGGRVERDGRQGFASMFRHGHFTASQVIPLPRRGARQGGVVCR